MKTAHFVSAAMLGLFVLAPWAEADPASTPYVPPNPYIQSDSDGAPLLISTRQSQSTDNSTDEQQQAEKNKNWLVRGYERAVQSRAAEGSGDDQSSNLYYQLSSNKDLARLAGLPLMDDSDDTSKSYRTGATLSEHGAVSLRQEAAPSTTSNFSPDAYLKPFLPPMNVSANSGAEGFYSSFDLGPSFTGGFTQAPQTLPTHARDQSLSSSDLETPGMVASEKDPLEDPSDLSIDALPGESPEQAQAHQENYSKLELSLPMSSDQLHTKQTAALTPPGQTKTTKTDTAGVVNAQKNPPVNTDTDPLPVSQALPITPVRSPIANPFDILNR